MKTRSETRTRTVPHTIGGTTHLIEETYTEQVPVLPRDWDTIALRSALGFVLALTVVGIVWSTVSIGSILGGGVGYAAATIFDAAWLTVLLLEWLSRFDAQKRAFPRKAGVVLVAVAAGAIFWHGMLAGGASGVALAVVGASVSVVSKVLWLAVFRHIDRPISRQDAAWVAAEESRISAQEAVTTVRLRASKAEEKAALRLLAVERIRAQLAPVRSEQLTAQLTEQAVEQPAELVDADERPEPVPVASSEPARPLTKPEPVITQARMVEPVDEEAEQREREVRLLADKLRSGEQLTNQRAGELLGVSRATGGRRLAEAKLLVQRDPSPYL